MSQFTFTPAAIEYARSYDIVQAMEEAFEGSLTAYFTAVKECIQRLTLPAPFREYSTLDGKGELLYWRLSTGRGNGRGPVHVWLYPFRPRVITDGFIAIGVGTEYTDSDRVARIRALETDPRFASHVEPGRGDRWWLFTVRIPAPPDALVSQPAELLADLLTALWEIEQA